ncbi:MAG TPA: ABC transporter ATP-binding protein [Verrucomicrobiae bacterium]|nr:ABC transporter ATP-binding protein [Verrucomicrobiae bacterium]
MSAPSQPASPGAVPNGKSEPAIRVCGVTKTFGMGDAQVTALKKVDFDARTGELLMVVGPSGCGKTTLLSVVAGTLNFDCGSIDVFEAGFHRMSPSEITAFRRENIGFIFQQFNLIPTLNILENASVPLLISGAGRKQAEAKAADLLQQVGLAGKERKLPTELSGGQQQRVAIARALVHDPRLIICDEPTSALDSENGTRVMELLQSVARHPRRLVIIVTHDNRVYRYADRMTEMEDGRVQRVHENYSANLKPAAH